MSKKILVGTPEHAAHIEALRRAVKELPEIKARYYREELDRLQAAAVLKDWAASLGLGYNTVGRWIRGAASPERALATALDRESRAGEIARLREKARKREADRAAGKRPGPQSRDWDRPGGRNCPDPVPFEIIRRAKTKPAGVSDARWRIELARRANPMRYSRIRPAGRCCPVHFVGDTGRV